MIRAVSRACLFSLALAGPAAAQSTAADILAALEAPTDELAQLTAILEGPDEEKALVAMRLMLGSGDPAMERLALRAGLSSTSGVMRGVSMDAFMESGPTLVAFAVGQEDNAEGFQRWIQTIGSLSSATEGSFPIEVGPYIEDENCYGSGDQPAQCYRRLGGTELSFYQGDAWGTARLNESGELVGSISNNRYVTGPIAITITLLGQLQ
jgi:hypothetical protein